MKGIYFYSKYNLLLYHLSLCIIIRICSDQNMYYYQPR